MKLDRRPLFVLISACIALVGAVGCNNPARPTPGVRSDPQPGSTYPVVAVEAALQRYLGVDEEAIVIDAPSDARPLHVSVPIRSLADNQMSLQYEFHWFDDAGRVVGRSGWQFLALEPRIQRRFTGNALSLKATRWRLEIRSSR